MNKRVKKYIVLLLAITVCFSGMAVTALAAPATDDGQGSSQIVGRETDSGVEQITLSFDLDGGSGLHNSKVDAGTKIEELKTPVRDGYDFDGWIVNGKKVPGSFKMDSDTFLKAAWVEAVASSEVESENESTGENSDSGKSESTASVASAASSASSAPASAASSQASSGTRFSMLFYVGILLVVLGIGGLVLLIIRQFHNRGGKGGPGSSGGSRNSGFTDISSYSDGRKHYTDITQSGDERRQPVMAATEPAYAAGNGSNFDWEKFFDGQNS